MEAVIDLPPFRWTPMLGPVPILECPRTLVLVGYCYSPGRRHANCPGDRVGYPRDEGRVELVGDIVSPEFHPEAVVAFEAGAEIQQRTARDLEELVAAEEREGGRAVAQATADEARPVVRDAVVVFNDARGLPFRSVREAV